MKGFLLLILSFYIFQLLLSKMTRIQLSRKSKKPYFTKKHVKYNKRKHSLSNHHLQEESIDLSDYEELEYSANIYIGSSSTIFDVIFDTGSAYIWVASNLCSNCNAYGIQKSYDCSQSLTCL